MKKTTKIDFIAKANKVHGDKYNYSDIEYIGTHVNIVINCPIHGQFNQSPANHLCGNGCPKCVGKNENINDFVFRASKTHNNKYDYSLSQFINKGGKIKIICVKHGIFEQRVSHHLNGVGCPKCVGKKKTTKDFIKECKLIHDNKYDYSFVNYINEKTKIKIICTEHSIFQQMAGKHLQGQGCPVCKESKGERKIRQYLIENKIKYTSQKRFKDCRDKKPLPFDFYLPDYNICIEYQRRQHYEPISNWGGIIGFNKILKRDTIKKNYCLKNDIKLILISDKESVADKISFYYQVSPPFLQNYE